MQKHRLPFFARQEFSEYKRGIKIRKEQTLCLLFFPGAKFSKDEVLTDETDVLTLKMSADELGVKAYAEMISGGRTARHERYEAYKSGITKVRAAKIASGIAVLACGEELFDCTPPWGIMTGVRPAKIAAPMIEGGMSANKVRQSLVRDYFLNPKKASLLTSIAEKEVTGRL